MTTVLTRAVARILLAPILVVAVAVLVKGHSEVGDGFSAGVVVALGILLQYAAFGRESAERALPLRRVALLAPAGLLAALAIAFAATIAGAPPLTHVPGGDTQPVEIGKLSLVSALALDVAVFALVVGATAGIVRAVALHGEEDDP